LIVAENFQEFQMYVVFEFEDSGHDLESFEVSNHFTGYAVIYCCTYNNNNNDRLTAFDPGQPG